MNASTYEIVGGNYHLGGTASRQVKESLKKIGVDPKTLRRVMVAAYEAEMNVVIHAFRGTMRVAIDSEQADFSVVDEGPGIPDIDKAMQEGFSTAPPIARELGFGAGMGLPNIRKNTDRFSIRSVPGHGTQLRFSIRLKSQEEGVVARNSVSVTQALCRKCLQCIRVCPTQAIRVRQEGPEIYAHLCVDCTSCIEVCEPRALNIRIDGEMPAVTDETVLVLPSSFLEQFGAAAGRERIFDVLSELGFRHVRVTDEWEQALRQATAEYVRGECGTLPAILPVCPAIVNLVTFRFPGLIPQLAPFLSPLESAREELTSPHVVYVPVCPSQMTLLSARNVLTRTDLIMPTVLRDAVLQRLAKEGGGSRTCAMREPVDSESTLQVSGIQHVLRVLDEMENGMLEDCTMVELYACDQGCFGAPVWEEDPFVARQRYGVSTALRSASCDASAVRQLMPPGARGGLRLDSDMRTAVEKLARIDSVAKGLPGRDCGACGAPTCLSLAEDVVLGRARVDYCVYLGVSLGNQALPVEENDP